MRKVEVAADDHCRTSQLLERLLGLLERLNNRGGDLVAATWRLVDVADQNAFFSIVHHAQGLHDVRRRQLPNADRCGPDVCHVNDDAAALLPILLN